MASESIALSLWLLAGILTQAGAKEFADREAPEIYTREIAPLLTALNDVKGNGRIEAPVEEPSTCLLNENLYYLADDGRRFYVEHQIYQANTKQGAREIAEANFECRKDGQKLWMPVARTLPSEGGEIEVRENAAFLSTSDGSSYYSLYEDLANLTVIFPKVEAGSITERVIVIEQTMTETPGEFLATIPWGRYEVQKRRRTVLVLPDEMAKRLTLTAVGTIPEPKVSELADGRRRWEWSQENVAALSFEFGQPSLRETGPLVFATTWSSWDDVASWYRKLSAPQAMIGVPLKESAARWTEGLDDPREVLSTLLEKVAREVRYTGLEFGLARVQPYDANEVWENRYGDCKDKATLLQGLLAEKDIRSHLVLLNSERTGYIDRRSPDYRHFDHVILAVDLGAEEYVFCDPTVDFAPAGILPSGDCDRDALVIKGEAAEWVRTPPHDPGTLAFEIDFVMEADGRVSGWVEVAATGFAAHLNRSLTTLDDQAERQQRAAGTLRHLYPQLTVADVDIPADQAPDGPFRFRAYLDVSSREPGAGLERQLRPPCTGAGLPYIFQGEDSPPRQWPLRLDPDSMTIGGRIKLPAGWQVESEPPSFDFKCDGVSIALAWNLDRAKRECRPAMRVEVEQIEVPPEEVPHFGAQIESVYAWLEKPMTLVPADAGALADLQRTSLTNFPRLTTGEGQLALVDSRYPIEGNLQLRRAALEKVLEWFPGNAKVSFLSQSDLANIELSEGKPAAGAQRIAAVLSAGRRDVGAEEFALGEYIHASCLDQVEGRRDEAIAIWSSLARNETLSPYRRAWSAWCAALALEAGGKRAEAVALIEPVLEHDGQLNHALSGILARCLAAENNYARIEAILRELRDGVNPFRFKATFQAMAHAAAELEGDSQNKLFALLSGFEGKEGDTEWRSQVLGEARAFGGVAARCREAKQRFSDYVAKHRGELDCFAMKITPQVRTREQYHGEQNRAEAAGNPKLAIRWCAEALLTLEADEAYPQELWNAQRFIVWSLEVLAREPAYRSLLEFLLSLTDTLPEAHASWTEGRLIRAMLHGVYEEHEDAKAVLEGLTKIETRGVGSLPAVWHRLGITHEKLGDFKAAEDCYKRLAELDQHPENCDGQARLVYLCLSTGRRDEAEEVLARLEKVDSQTLSQAQYRGLVEELNDLRREAHAHAYWESSRNWWPKWLALEKAATLPGEENTPHVPIPQNPVLLGAELGSTLQAGPRTYALLVRELAHGARWNPSQVSSFVTALTVMPNALPGRRQQIQQLTVEICESYPFPGDSAGRRCQLMLAAVAYDLAEEEKCARTIDGFFERDDGAADEVSYAMAGIQAALAVKTGNNQEAAADRFIKIYHDVDGPLQNPYAALMQAAALLEELGREDDLIALFNEELKRPRLKSFSNVERAIRAKLKEFESGRMGRDPEAFAHFRKEWLEQFGPPWLAYAKPVDHVGSEFGFDFPGEDFKQAEHVKHLVIRSGDDGQSLVERQRALLRAARFLSGMTTDDPARIALYDSALSAEAIPEKLRRKHFQELIIGASFGPGQEALDFLREHPFMPSEPELQGITKRVLDQAGGRIKAITRSPQEISRLAMETLSGGELNRPQLFELSNAITRLYRLGATEEAEELARKAGETEVGGDLKPIERSLELRKVQRGGVEDARMYDALRNYTAGKLPEEYEAAASIKFTTATDFIPHHANSAEEADRRVLAILRLGAVDPVLAVSFLIEFYNRGGAAQRRELCHGWFQTALAAAPDDSVRAAVIEMASRELDFDDPATREFTSNLVKPFRNVRQHPECYAVIRLIELSNATRAGEKVDWENGADEAREAFPERLLRMELENLIRRRDRAALVKVLDRADPDLLLKPTLIALATRACALLGREDEAALFRDEIRQQLYELVLRNWISPVALGLVPLEFELHEAVPDELEKIPDPYLHHMTRHPWREQGLMYTAELAMARKEWKTAEDAAMELIEQRPALYDLYWIAGAAAAQLGHAEQAIEWLAIYVKYSKDRINHSEATALLERLRGESDEAEPR